MYVYFLADMYTYSVTDIINTLLYYLKDGLVGSGADVNDICTTTSECDYDHGYCYKVDTCGHNGTCACENGYGLSRMKCMKGE